MCLAIYISSDNSIPVVNLFKDKIGFYIRELEKHENYVFQNFSKRLAYYLGSEGCSYGFSMDGIYPDMEEFVDVRETYHLFSNFLREKVESKELEIYACWVGKESAKPTEYHRIKTSEIAKTDFAFEEGCFYSVDNF